MPFKKLGFSVIHDHMVHVKSNLYKGKNKLIALHFNLPMKIHYKQMLLITPHPQINSKRI